MNKIKDMLYDINDIIVAAVILFIAAIIILIRVDILMAYPEHANSDLASQGGYIIAGEPQTPDETASAPDATDENPADTQTTDENPAGNTDGNPGDTSGETPANGGHTAFSLYIAYGESMNVVAANLVELGFFDSAQDFISALEARGAATKVQAGEFILPAASTKEEILDIITKPPKQQ